MYNKQDVLQLVLSSLLDGTLQNKSDKSDTAYKDLRVKVITPFFAFISKYTLFEHGGYASVNAAECTKVLNSLLGLYQDVHGWTEKEDLTQKQVVALFVEYGIQPRKVKTKNRTDLHINKKVYAVLRDVSGITEEVAAEVDTTDTGVIE